MNSLSSQWRFPGNDLCVGTAAPPGCPDLQGAQPSVDSPYQAPLHIRQRRAKILDLAATSPTISI